MPRGKTPRQRRQTRRQRAECGWFENLKRDITEYITEYIPELPELKAVGLALVLFLGAGVAGGAGYLAGGAGNSCSPEESIIKSYLVPNSLETIKPIFPTTEPTSEPTSEPTTDESGEDPAVKIFECMKKFENDDKGINKCILENTGAFEIR